MENNVISLDTAKKLKAAGFPQDYNNMIWWNRPNHKPAHLLEPAWYVEQSVGSSGKFYAAPTAQEIADQLPPWEDMGRYPCLLNVQPNPIGKGWNAMYRHDSTSPKEHHCGAINLVTGDTMAEALASLYLKLHAPARQLSQGETQE